MMVKIFLDDYRIPSHCVEYMSRRIGSGAAAVYKDDDDWIVVKNYKEFCDAVNEHIGDISCISFDHDLHDEHYVPEDFWDDYDRAKIHMDDTYDSYKEKTGYDAALWLDNLYRESKLTLPAILVHSMNPVGVDKIKKVFNIS